jgi:hypothetical protein
MISTGLVSSREAQNSLNLAVQQYNCQGPGLYLLVVGEGHVRGTGGDEAGGGVVLPVQHTECDEVQCGGQGGGLQEGTAGVQGVQVEPGLHRRLPLCTALQLKLCRASHQEQAHGARGGGKVERRSASKTGQ